MKISKFLARAVIALLLIGNGGESFAAPLQDINGNAVQLKDFQGKWLIINYWASWCLPCAKEIPELNAFYQKHKDKDAVLLGVNADQLSGAALQKAVEKLSIQFPVLTIDPAQELGLQEVPGVPTTYLINPKGEITKVLLGAQSQKSLEEEIG